jgi:hypothetical protein
MLVTRNVYLKVGTGKVTFCWELAGGSISTTGNKMMGT